MPCLDNLLTSPPGLSSRAELKPIILREAQLDPELNPGATREPDPEGFELGSHLAELCVDDKQEECGFKGNSGREGGPIGKRLESDPEKGLGSIFQSKFRSEAIDGDEIERASIPCRVIGPTTGELGQECSKRKIDEGVSEFNCSLQFLAGAPESVQCLVCLNTVYPEAEEKIVCSIRGCQSVFHSTCAKENLKFSSSKKFKCPQHACFLCNQKNHLWRCMKCTIACHDKCVPFPEHVLKFPDRPGEAICWRHTANWHQEKHVVPANNLEDVFALLPLPYKVEEFEIDKKWKEQSETKLEQNPYTHIKRIRLMMILDAQAAVLQIALMVVCAGSVHQLLKSLPLLQQLYKPAFSESEKDPDCRVAAESIKKEDFIVEYVGEVIDDAMCERRLWDMKDQDAKNFYMCEINKDFVIDATFKGNASRFLNHSCAPNCKLEKWQVEGEVRVGVFASKSIKAGEALTYDYRFVQFGPEVECRCGAPSCSGYLGTKRKIVFAPRTKRKIVLTASWGLKRQRTTKRYVGTILY
ncbi:hypothetical protein CASFOL_013809 [Castilleja foliolosa]|uniref:Uncharacterized protein n=1 Tax=Castilleja foliolosa TaxID=1961234 RepID=A0ABD3DPP1_9LAMI